MGIVDWFKNRPGEYDPDRVSDELVQWGVEKAITLSNPRLKLLPTCQKRLTPAVATTIEFLREQARALPAIRPVSSTSWSADPALRAFFVAPSDIATLLGRSDNLRTLFDKAPELDVGKKKDLTPPMLLFIPRWTRLPVAGGVSRGVG
jgi:hypothetical protein